MLKVLPKTLEVHYDNPNRGYLVWLVESWKSPWCKFVIFVLIYTSWVIQYIEYTHVVQFNDFYIDIACNCYI